MLRDVRYQGAILRDDHVLLIRHVHHADGRAYWLLPGGGIEPGESAEDCVAREMWEETGLRVRVEGLLFETEAEGRPYRSRRTYRCGVLSGEARPGYEPEPDAAAAYAIVDVAWLDLRAPAGWPPEVMADQITGPQMDRLRAELGYAP